MLKDNLEKIFNDIESGNNFGEKITLVGATKTVPVETINKAINYGLSVVAENKVQEFREKTDKIVGAKQHFIGHLQSNKIKYLVGKVSVIQSVDSFGLAKQISDYALKKNVVQDILVEINIGEEESKSGILPVDAVFTVKEMSHLKGIKIVGLMSMLPKSDDEEKLANLCDKLRNIYDELKINLPFEYLSIGMSNDYLIAIKHGSNMIRIGSKIFGERNYGEKQ